MKNVMIKFKNSRKSSYVIEKDILKDKSEQFQLIPVIIEDA